MVIVFRPAALLAFGLAGLLLAADALAAQAARSMAQAEESAGPPPAKPGGEGAKPPPAAKILDKDESQGVLGKSVLDAGGKEMGRIVNVIVDRAGQPRAAIIDFGGFLGVGSRKIAVDWSALRFAPQADKADRITLDLMREQLKAAPEFKEGRPIVVLGASGGEQPLPGDGPFTLEP